MATASICVSLITFSILLHFAGYYVLFNQVEPFLYFFYIAAWWSYIFIVDGILALKKKSFLIFNRHLAGMVIISCGFWCFFEIINLRLQNWFYISLPGDTLLRHTGYLFAYGTVIPAIFITKEFVKNIIREIRIKPILINHYPFYSISFGIIIFILVCVLPDFFFAFTWIFLAFILDGYNYKKGYRSFMGDLEKGKMTDLISTIASGFVCGILWEAWNSFSVSKWVYSVPLFENLKIFEMPLPGYIGFLIFALETVTFVNFLDGIKSHKKSIPLIAIIAFTLSIFSFSLIDKYTVFSTAPGIGHIDFIAGERIDYLKANGVRTSYGIDIKILSRQERDDIEFLHLKGLGLQNYTRLKRSGITDISGLSKLDEKSLALILSESNMRRVRVYLNSAKKAANR